MWQIGGHYQGGITLSPPRTPDTPSITFIASTDDLTNTTVYTFTAHPIGDVFASRIVAVACHSDAGSVTLSNVTIGGSSCAIVSAAAVSQPKCGIAHLGVASSTAADIVVTWSGAVQRCSIGVWSIVGMGSTTPVSSTAPALSSSTLHSISVDLPTTASYGVAAITNATNINFGWTNATENYDRSQEGGSRVAGATLSGAAASTGTVVVHTTHVLDSAEMVGVTWV
jgi:hypothetical protein